MSSLPILDVETAPAGSKEILQGAQQAMGFVPNLFGVLASSPAALEAYTTLSKLQDAKTDFSETERQVLFLSISAQNGCGYCVAAHSAISSMKRVPDDVVRALRSGSALPDPKLEALRSFALAVVEERGWVAGEALDAFRAAGYGDRHVLEVILAVAFKTISNFTNHVSGTDLDPAFQPQAWTAGAVA